MSFRSFDKVLIFINLAVVCTGSLEMTLYVLWFVIAFFGIALGHPTGRNQTRNYPFVYPTERTNSIVGVRLIGGQEAQPHAHPYQVGLYCHGVTVTHFCGGSLVSPNYVLTAAHCVDEIVNADLIFGAHAIEENETSQIRQTSDQFIVHPDWNRDELVNDIALVKLVAPIQETDYIKVIRITPATETFAGQKGVITGWGATSTSQQTVSPHLRYAASDILSNDECKSFDQYDAVIQPTHLCLSGSSENGNVGTCNGDSGGPLTVGGYQVGAVSFGSSDCESGKPSVFSRLTMFRDWIRDNSDVDV